MIHAAREDGLSFGVKPGSARNADGQTVIELRSTTKQQQKLHFIYKNSCSSWRLGVYPNSPSEVNLVSSF